MTRIVRKHQAHLYLLSPLLPAHCYVFATTLRPLNRREGKQSNQPVKARKIESMQTQSYKEPLQAPFEWYRTMRATQPVFQHPDWGGWQVFRYADVTRVLSEYATFSSASFDDQSDPISSSILQMDPPRHRQ